MPQLHAQQGLRHHSRPRTRLACADLCAHVTRLEAATKTATRGGVREANGKAVEMAFREG